MRKLLDILDVHKPHIKIPYSEAIRQIRENSPTKWRVVLELQQRTTRNSWYAQAVLPNLTNGTVIAAVDPEKLMDDYPHVGCKSVKIVKLIRANDISAYGILHDGIRGWRVPAAFLSRHNHIFALSHSSEPSEDLYVLDGGIRTFIEQAEAMHAGDARIWFGKGGRLNRE